jgi:hypothetical protein
MPGAVNSPSEVTVPSVVDQVTPRFVVPDTVAVKSCLAPDLRVTVAGLMETEIAKDPSGIKGWIVTVVVVLPAAVRAVINAIVTVVTVGAL